MRSFYHAGDLGDVVYGLYAVKRLGGGHLLLGKETGHPTLGPRDGVSWAMFERFAELLNHQPYIERIDWCSFVPFVDYDLNCFRSYWSPMRPARMKLPATCHLLDMYAAFFGFDLDCEEPWLTADRKRVAKYVFARSPRQHNPDFPWGELVARLGREAVFVGYDHEYADFINRFGQVEYCHTPHFWALACVINGCDRFYGNSSMALALAEGLKKPLVQEISVQTNEKAHTFMRRDGAVNWEGGGVPL